MGILELVYINTKKRRGDREYYVLFVFAVIVIIVGIYLGKLAISYSHDAANHSYIVYEGDFLVEKYYKNAPLIYLPDKEGIRMELNKSAYYKHISEPGKYTGKYTGKLVYAEKSKYIVDILNAVKCEE